MSGKRIKKLALLVLFVLMSISTSPLVALASECGTTGSGCG